MKFHYLPMVMVMALAFAPTAWADNNETAVQAASDAVAEVLANAEQPTQKAEENQQANQVSAESAYSIEQTLVAPKNHYALNFQMPSGNVVCGGDLMNQDENASPWHGVACVMVTPISLPKKIDQSCSHGWGYEFIVAPAGEASRPCHAHLPVQFDAPVLKYGSKIKGKGWECSSETSGLTCVNNDKHGFKLRKYEQVLF